MKRWFGVVCLVFLLGGCGTGGKVPILSPTLPEDEVRERTRELPVIKLEPASKDGKAVPEKGMPEREKVQLREAPPSKETAQSEPSLTGADNAVEALVNLLEKKGIVTKKELSEEIMRLKQRQK